MICFPLNNTDYEADALGAWFGTRTRGVFSADNHFSVSTNGDMTVTVGGGLAWLLMGDYWGTVVLETDPQTLTLDTADGSLARVDAICLQLDKNANLAKLTIKKGAYSPQPAVITDPARNQDYDEIYVAAVAVRAGATSILPTDITDLRLDETYCGVMRDGVSGIPTQALQDMWTVWFSAWKTQTDQDFEAWFDTVKGLLGEDEAGALALAIEDVKGMVTNPNLLINGGFDVWQELESYTLTGASVVGYCADQWHTWSSGTNTGSNALITRSDAGLRMQHNGFAGYTFIAQTVDETIKPRLAGKTVTLSFEATVSQGGHLNGVLWDAKKFGRYGASDTGTSLASIPVTGDGTRHMYSVTGVVPADITDLDVVFNSPNNQATHDYTLHWVKLELGGAATPYVPADYATELMRCMRYYWRPKGTFATHNVIADTIYLYAGLWFPVPMRTTPTVIPYETLNVSYPDNPEGYKFGAENWGAPNHVWKFGHYDRTDYKRVTDITVNKDRIDMFVINDNTNTAGEKFECHLEIDARRYS
ncbi:MULTISPECIES: hypothetical protein [unclassified Clostridium]|uniref:hypothetical protein n=1 Tax=unclassified Clostridium TaxID=2614128 RepID=UPI001106FF3A|nr:MULTISPECIES: hypothetical protein [unclassified Clostridium]